jgi:hypothetical protein
MDINNQVAQLKWNQSVIFKKLFPATPASFHLFQIIWLLPLDYYRAIWVCLKKEIATKNVELNNLLTNGKADLLYSNLPIFFLRPDKVLSNADQASGY